MIRNSHNAGDDIILQHSIVSSNYVILLSQHNVHLKNDSIQNQWWNSTKHLQDYLILTPNIIAWPCFAILIQTFAKH